MEDNQMSENRFTVSYLLEQIAKIQEQFTDLKNTINNIGCVADCDRADDAENEKVTVHEEISLRQISALTEVFHHREESLAKLLDFYRKAFDRASQAEMIAKAFDGFTKQISDSNLKPEDQYAILADIPERITELLSPVPSEKMRIVSMLIRELGNSQMNDAAKDRIMEIMQCSLQDLSKNLT